MSGRNTLSRSGASIPATAERRAWVRYYSSLRTLCQASSARIEDFWQLAKILDISVSGVSLYLNRPFEVDCTLVVDPLHPKATTLPSIVARVVHVQPQDHGGWLMGCEFEHPLTEEQLQALICEDYPNGIREE
jgi:hypothetical protein